MQLREVSALAETWANEVSRICWVRRAERSDSGVKVQRTFSVFLKKFIFIILLLLGFYRYLFLFFVFKKWKREIKGVNFIFQNSLF